MMKLFPFLLLSACAQIKQHPFPCEVGISGDYSAYLNDNNSTCLYGFDDSMKFVLVLLQRTKQVYDFNAIVVIDKDGKASYSLVENNTHFDCGQQDVNIAYKSLQSPTEFSMRSTCNDKEINLDVYYYYSYNPNWNME